MGVRLATFFEVFLRVVVARARVAFLERAFVAFLVPAFFLAAAFFFALLRAGMNAPPSETRCGEFPLRKTWVKQWAALFSRGGESAPAAEAGCGSNQLAGC